MTARDKPGFWFGVSSVFRGAAFIATRPRAWPYALVPALILVSLLVAFVWGALGLAQALFAAPGSPGAAPGDWDALLRTAVSWVATVVAVAIGIVLALVLTPPLSGPALERIVLFQEREIGAPPREELGLLTEIWCGIRAQVFVAIFALPTLLALWIVELLFPPAAIVTVPLGFVVASLSLAWNLLDYPLTLRGVRMRDRFSLVMRHKAAALGFGAAFAVLFWVPCFGILLLPVGAAAATRVLWRILETDPELLPGLSRPSPRTQERSIAMPS